jgi:diaminopimelate epimerase
MSQAYVKMNGLGNDFAVIDARGTAFTPEPAQIRVWSNRVSGLGFDQLIALESSKGHDTFMRVWNADGTRVETCGNALRCVGWLLDRNATGRVLGIDTEAGLVRAKVMVGGERTGIVSVDMGCPKLEWQEIPLAEEMNSLRLELQIGPIDAPLYHTPSAVNMGNPHVVFFVEEIDTVDVAAAGSLIENHPLFPEGVNVEFVQVLDRQTLRMRVWERGAGITNACGTGACAALVAASRRGLGERSAQVIMDGGALQIEWKANDHVIMTGEVVLEHHGLLP